MRDNGGGALTYQVITDELVQAAESVREITSSAQQGTVETLPETIAATGHGDLGVALREFCGRWDTGLSHLVGDSTAMTDALEKCAQAYVDNEDRTRQGFEQPAGEPGHAAAAATGARSSGPQGAAAAPGDQGPGW